MDMLTQADGNPSRGISASQRNRLQTLDQTHAEIDALAAEYHGRLPRDRARAVGAIYARFSTKFQHSIGDQVRTLFEAAVAKEIFVPREFICVDIAVRGHKNRRPGLDQLRTIVARKDREVDVLLVFSTNRLFRKTYRSLQFVEEQVVDRGIRCVFVSSGIDTADKDRWRMMLQVHAMADEAQGSMYANHVRAAHEGLFSRGLITGTLPIGYRGREVPGERTKRNLVRRAVEVDPDAAPWVVRAYRWFADDRLAISEIARRFNANPEIPRGAQFRTNRWTAMTVRALLANPRYRGRWEYGVSQTVWQNQKDYGRQIRRAEPLKSAHREDLRIVDDALWDRVRQRLDRNDRSAAGRKPRDGDRKSRPRLLNGVFFCASHGQKMHVGGSNGLMSYCKDCRVLAADHRPLYSLLNRERALRLTCETLADLIRRDETLIPGVIAACRDHADAVQKPDPSRIKALKSRHDGLTRKLDFILNDPGETESDRAESRARVKQIRLERGRIAAELEPLEQAGSRPAIVPAESEVRQLIGQLGDILASAASNQGPEEEARVREVVDLLTGGRIDLHQAGERRAQHGWLQGRFRVRLLAGLVEKLTGVPPDQDSETEVVTIDFDNPSPSEAIADRAKELYDQGVLIKAIAIKLGITRVMVDKALVHWYRRRGLPRPDGRSRRSTLERKHLEPPKFVALSEDVMQLFRDGLSYIQIAAQLAIDRNTVNKVVAHYHQSRGLPVPDGRNRRKELNQFRSRKTDRATPPSAA